MRRMRAWWLFCLLIALIGTSFFLGNFIDLTSAGHGFGIGYGSVPRAHFDDTPFSIGPPSRYHNEGVYTDHLANHGVYVVSHMGIIVALSAHNPVNGKTIRYEPVTGQFSDPTTGSRFTRDGLVTSINRAQRRTLDDPEQVKNLLDEGADLERSMERCYIRLRGNRKDPDAQLMVNPRHRFIFELNQWSREYCLYPLDKD